MVSELWAFGPPKGLPAMPDQRDAQLLGELPLEGEAKEHRRLGDPRPVVEGLFAADRTAEIRRSQFEGRNPLLIAGGNAAAGGTTGMPCKFRRRMLY